MRQAPRTAPPAGFWPLLFAALLVAGCETALVTPEPTASAASPRPTFGPPPTSEPSPSSQVSATPPPSPSPSPSPLPSQTARPSAAPSASPALEAFSINLYREGAFVSEYTVYYCLPAAMQVMINIMSEDEPDTSRETQDRLYELARELDGYDHPRRVRDVEPEGWARGLETEGFGRWGVRAEDTREEAIRLAALQLRQTGKPVGLLTWRGAHSWVMSGFESSADPLLTDDFEVSAVWIQDVWWPRISTRWGESDPPNTLVPVERLPEDYRRYRRPYGEFPDKDGKFVLVVPLADE